MVAPPSELGAVKATDKDPSPGVMEVIDGAVGAVAAATV
jgi:hypothetical protein